MIIHDSTINLATLIVNSLVHPYKESVVNTQIESVAKEIESLILNRTKEAVIMERNMSKLKPCPYCGGTDLIDQYVYIQCKKCYMTGPKQNKGINDDHVDSVDHEHAIDNWNELPRRF